MGYHWSSEEEEILKENYFDASKDHLLSFLPNRQWGAILTKACRLGLKRSIIHSWQECELSRLLRGEATEFEKGFIVGLFEGEGSIIIGVDKKRQSGIVTFPIMEIANTNLELIKKAQKIIGGKIYKDSSRCKQGKKLMHSLRLTRQLSVFETLTHLLPYLTAKKEEATLVLNFIKLKTRKHRCEPVTRDELSIIKKLKKLHCRQPK